MNQNETDQLADMLFVIKKAFMENNRQNELAHWYQYAIEDDMLYFKERIIKKYTSLINDQNNLDRRF